VLLGICGAAVREPNLRIGDSEADVQPSSTVQEKSPVATGLHDERVRIVLTAGYTKPSETPMPTDPRDPPPAADYQPPSSASLRRALAANAAESMQHVWANAENGAKEGLRAAIDVYGPEPFVVYDRLCDTTAPVRMRQYLHEILAERVGR
jgi:hypothetical protein